jgi:UDP-N-acetylglucosamine pyrophosphorylase
MSWIPNTGFYEARATKFNILKLSRTEEDMEAWYPPGHGDFYQAFANSGLLEEFIGQVCIVCDIKKTVA